MNDNSHAACRKCRTTIAQNTTGRPALYCSISCRRASEQEIRRIQQRLANLEDQLIDCKLNRSSMMYWDGTSAEERSTLLREVIAEEEAKFKALLGGDDSQEAESLME